jgi:hypothetical protein
LRYEAIHFSSRFKIDKLSQTLSKSREHAQVNKLKIGAAFNALINVVLVSALAAAPAWGKTKPRVVVTTDPELDDNNSLLRYLLYSTDFQTEGLIYASSAFHWKGDGKGTRYSVPGREYSRLRPNPCPCTSWRWPLDSRFIDENVAAYEKSYPNLKIHSADYPSPRELRAKIRWGNVEFDGDISRDSDGSRLIAALLLDNNPDPLYLLAWGGASTIARALKSIEERYGNSPRWMKIRRGVSHKAIIQTFGDQDDTLKRYVKPNWPEVEIRQMATQTYGYDARGAVLPADQVYLSGAWTRENVSSRGSMGERYRVWGDGKQMVAGDIFDYFGLAGFTIEQLKMQRYVVFTPVQEQGSWISEGDSSTFMNLIHNGLRGHENASFGGWGGRNGTDSGPKGPNTQYASARFFGAAQRDLAARFKWAVTPQYSGANHAPSVLVKGPLLRTVRAGEVVELRGAASDPDGDDVRTGWWQYAEAGSYFGNVPVSAEDSKTVSVHIPRDARSGDTIHMILEGEDSGSPRLTRYARVILEVKTYHGQAIVRRGARTK